MPTWAWLLVCFVAFHAGFLLAALLAAAKDEPLPPDERYEKMTAHVSGRILASHDEGDLHFIDKVEWDSVDIQPREPFPHHLNLCTDERLPPEKDTR